MTLNVLIYNTNNDLIDYYPQTIMDAKLIVLGVVLCAALLVHNVDSIKIILGDRYCGIDLTAKKEQVCKGKRDIGENRLKHSSCRSPI